ncbi:MAG: hypothetical protein Q8K59_03820 [Nitrosomonas sp.]|nr:hypothetical protein [Nitrosomonas sp.]MDP1950216.1 hypothetical protein [Nitrosomonas sp.]
MVTKRGKQASRKAAARKYGFLAVPLSIIIQTPQLPRDGIDSRHSRKQEFLFYS